jgi:hypothetical protein
MNAERPAAFLAYALTIEDAMYGLGAVFEHDYDDPADWWKQG